MSTLLGVFHERVSKCLYKCLPRAFSKRSVLVYIQAINTHYFKELRSKWVQNASDI